MQINHTQLVVRRVGVNEYSKWIQNSNSFPQHTNIKKRKQDLFPSATGFKLCQLEDIKEETN